MNRAGQIGLGLSMLMLAGASASGAYTVTNGVPMSGYGADLDAVVGSGIPNSNFVRANNDDLGIEVGLKAIERYVGDLPRTGIRYQAAPGITPGQGGSPDGATWNYVLVIDLGSFTFNEVQATLRVDFDPAVNSTNFVEVDINAVLGTLGQLGLSELGDSQNLDFDFWQLLYSAPGFDPNANGEYELELELVDPANTSDVYGRSRIIVEVPTPGSMALAFLASLTSIRRRRR